jgi:hypothetical protein
MRGKENSKALKKNKEQMKRDNERDGELKK